MLWENLRKHISWEDTNITAITLFNAIQKPLQCSFLTACLSRGELPRLWTEWVLRRCGEVHCNRTEEIRLHQCTTLEYQTRAGIFLPFFSFFLLFSLFLYIDFLVCNPWGHSSFPSRRLAAMAGRNSWPWRQLAATLKELVPKNCFST